MRALSKLGLSLCLLVSSLLVPAVAAAQRGGDIVLDGFRPPLDTNGYVTVDGAATTPPAQVSFGLYTTWARGLLRLDGPDTSYQVHDVLSPTLVASVGLPRLPIALGASLPFGVVSTTAGDDRIAGQGLGDLGLHVKLGLGRHAALAGSLWLPTAATDSWLGAGAASGQVRVVVEGRAGRLRGALNAGLRLRAGGAAEFMDGASTPGMHIAAGAALPVGGGLAYGLAPGKLDLVVESWALIPLDGDGYAPVEALAGLKVHLAAASHLTLGGGAGLGPDGGNPDARAFLAIVFEPGRATAARAIIPDVAPPPALPIDDDRDADRIRDDVDRCPDDPEDYDRLEDDDGCPDTDVDGDHLADDQDLCATEAEDLDGLEDDDGCPETDADRDRVADTDDRCPLVPETRNGVVDDDGCPDNDRITFTEGTFETLDPIYFEFDSAIIKSESYPVVQAIADALRARPQVRLMEIGGHTDWQGADGYNLRLSQARAAAVRAFLVDAGIDPARLRSEGYGESQPLDDHHTATAAARNRRVEFLILASHPD